MAVQVEMWQPVIKEQLFKSNSFMAHLKNEDEYTVGGRIVHIPQSGGPADIEKNRSVLPAVVVQRTDTDITYPLDEYTTDPVHIPHADQVELSYEKTASVVRENTSSLMEFVGDDLIYKLVENTPAANKIAATGADAPATASGATGTRKIITEADIRAAQTLLNKMNVPKEERYLLLDSDMYNQLLSDDNLKYAFQQVVNLPDGVLARIYGFNIIERSAVIRVDASFDPKLPTAADAATDSVAALFWQKDFLARALGEVTMFERMQDPTYYGDIYSFLLRMGGRACRSDNKGYGFIHRTA